MKGKVNWIHVLQIFSVGLLGIIIFMMFVLPRNISNIKAYTNSLEQMKKTKKEMSEMYSISVGYVEEWTKKINSHPDMWYVNDKKMQREYNAEFISDDYRTDTYVMEYGWANSKITLDEWTAIHFINNKEIVNSETFKKYMAAKDKYDINKSSVNAVLLTILLPLSVTLVFCGVKIYEDIKG